MAWLPVLVAVFAWWFSTGLILLAVRLADRGGAARRRQVTFAALPLLVVGLWGYWATIGRPELAYAAFLSALAIWGWIELAFLTGAITGPVLTPCPPGLPEWERFIRAWGTIAHHEILLLVALLGLWHLKGDAAGAVGFWTFAVLWAARISAKLNLFFGVPRINTEFLPSVLTHLGSHFRIAPVNWLFPVSVTGLTFALACWLERWSAGGPEAATGFALLAAITALALLEHWLMVLPLPDARLWRWMLPEPRGGGRRMKEEPNGF